MLWPGLQEPTGSALPASEGKGLDNTSSEPSNKPVVPVGSLSADNSGWTWVQKLMILSVILGGIVIFVRTRKGHVADGKSLA